MNNFKIKTKLILLFVIIKIIPLLILAYIAIEGAKNLNLYFEETTKDTFSKNKSIIETTASTAISDSIKALDEKSQFALERLSYETANNISSFLYERDKDLLFLSTLPMNEKLLDNFRMVKTNSISVHPKYSYNDKTNKWEQKEQSKLLSSITKSSLKENEKNYHQNILPHINLKEVPLYKEIQFINLDGQEIYKSSSISNKKLDIKIRTNTYINSESYFDDLKNLKKGEIYVSNVIGEYVRSGLIGRFTKEKAKKMNIDFDPKSNAYAGKENPNGKRFEGIIRFATPIFQNEIKVGYITFALDHRHIMEFTDSLDPLVHHTKQDIADASSGNYAFMWDNKGRNISHPRDYFIAGYDSSTGERVPGWVSLDIANKFKESDKKNLNEFLKEYPKFEQQSLQKKPNMSQLKDNGEIGLDCRYLNFAPQCQGWMDLTKEGSYGSFIIFWSGVWKLTTAAAIPYYTGQYGESKRGFGFVTIGANVDDFHLAANKTKENIDNILEKQVHIMQEELNERKFSILNYINNLTHELTVVTIIMLIIVIIIAIWMSNIVTSKITNLLTGTQEYSKENFDYKIKVTSNDEIGELENSFNTMASGIQKLLAKQKNINTLLDIKVDEANAASEAKNEFMTSMSHEIRTPLNSILGFVDILKEQEKNTENIKYFNIIEHSGNNLLTIINDILDFSKIEANKIELEYNQINPSEEFTIIMNQFSHNAKKKNISLSLNISSDLPQCITIDLLKINQVLNNLISNAIKFTKENGEITFTVECKETNHLSISVIDNGIGIAKEKLEVIFEPFSQEDNSTTREYGGTGLGLTISSKLVELMGGELKLLSTKESGSNFHFKIPYKICTEKKQELITEKELENIDLNTTKNLHILIAEDNKTNQIFIQVIMKKLALTFDIANNGKEAVELYRKNQYDLIFMDENMPLMTGSEATIEIRQIEQKTKKQTPIIALTANALKGDKKRFIEVGMDDYLSKPVKKEDIKDIIKKYT